MRKPINKRPRCEPIAVDDIRVLIDFWVEIGQTFQAKSRWSMYDESGKEPDAVGIEGTGLKLVYRDYWSTEFQQLKTMDEILSAPRPAEIAIALPDNPTWRQLYVAADKLIQKSGDQHHIFIEAFDPDPVEPNTFRLITGS